MKLAMLQRRFHASICIADGRDDIDWEAGQRPGLRVYRNAYRARLMACLRDSFRRTAAWVGDDSFDAAAADHLIRRPPASWTLDEAGRDFDATLGALFPNDPEIAELAWLEGAMQDAFAGPDAEAWTPETFAAATSQWDDGAWAGLHLVFVPTLSWREVTTACAAVWHAIENDTAVPDRLALDTPATLGVWRRGLQPRFRVLDADEAAAMRAIAPARTFGELCAKLIARHGEDTGTQAAGRLLGGWIAEGMLVRQPH